MYRSIILFSALLLGGCQANDMNDALNLASLEDTQWLLEDLNGHGVIDNARTTLIFKKDNKMGGNGGCNQWFGSYKQTEEKISIDSIGSTKKLCIGASMKQETDFLQALNHIEKAYYDDKNRLLIDISGKEKPLVFTKIKP